MAEAFTIDQQGDRKKRIADHVALVAGTDENGKARYLRVNSNGSLASGAVPAVVAASSFARPADTTPYASGDLVANNTTAGSVTPISLSVARANDAIVRLKRVRLKKSGTGVTNAAFRVHFFRSSPVSAAGDNAAFSTPESNYLGSVDVTIAQAFTDGASGQAAADIIFAPTSGAKTVFALLEARGAYTPASAETFTLTVEVEQY